MFSKLFQRKARSKDKKSASSNSLIITSNACNNGASQSAADTILFPLQYNGETYNAKSFKEELFFVPFKKANYKKLAKDYTQFFKNGKLNNKHGFVCLLIHGNPRNIPKYFMILFHGNGVDLGLASVMWRPLIRSLPIHMLIVEYPGYGIMNGKCTCDNILKISTHVYQFVTNNHKNRGLGIDPSKIIILGRSIGTGPASYLAKFDCNSLILVSPFTSIHNLGNDKIGKLSGWLLAKDDNDDDIENGNETKKDTINSDDSHGFSLDPDTGDTQYNTSDDEKNEIVLVNNDNNNISDTVINMNKKSTFVFNNKRQIKKWKCKNVIIFHGKNDTLIPCKHSIELINEIKKYKHINYKLHEINGVGHNDISTQYIALRTFTHFNNNKYSDDNSIYGYGQLKINHIVKFVECPPYFDIDINKVISTKTPTIIHDDEEEDYNLIITNNTSTLDVFNKPKITPQTSQHKSDHISETPSNITKGGDKESISDKKQKTTKKPIEITENIYNIGDNENIFNESCHSNEFNPYKITRIYMLYQYLKRKKGKQTKKDVNKIVCVQLPSTGL